MRDLTPFYMALALLAWSGLCVLAGQIWETLCERRRIAQREAEDMARLESWANAKWADNDMERTA